MVSGIDYEKKYDSAQTAYLAGDLHLASKITDEIIRDYPDDPTALLLKGHIHLRQQQYDQAKYSYERVLRVTDYPEIVNLANQGLEQINEELEFEQENEEDDFYPLEVEKPSFENDIEEIDENEVGNNWTNSIQFDSIDWSVEDLEDEDIQDPTVQQGAPFDTKGISITTQPNSDIFKTNYDPDDVEDEETGVGLDRESSEWGQKNYSLARQGEKSDFSNSFQSQELDVDLSSEDLEYTERQITNNLNSKINPESLEDLGSPTFVVSSKNSELVDLEEMLTNSNDNMLDDFDDDFEYSSELEPITSTSGGLTPLPDSKINYDGELSLLPDGDDGIFSASDELDDIPDIGPDELPVSSIFTTKEQKLNNSFDFDEDFDDSEITGIGFDINTVNFDEDELDVPSSLSEFSSVTTTTINSTTPEVEIHQGKLGKYYDLSLELKNLVHGGVTGIATFLLVFLISVFQGNIKVEGQKNSISYPWSKRFLLSLVAGLTSGGATVATGYWFANHIKRYTSDLQNQFEYIYRGNYDVKATVYSQDEFGTLATGFNQMTRMINTTTTEAKKRAEETEKAREDLQRQVIRLLDDVEGAARGDLTVQAEVTADVLGAVADAFNLTITNLRKIVRQVKQAAVQVNQASTDSELFARNQSSDALRMAEELAVTLNSVQMMTDSIQRVAENAREAEEVARSSSVTALKGGDAVERTVAGILQIRETVSETTRKVKRLAEASQQISTIVAVISQISSRTNLLALNASIQAARAGEAGRGFAIVADEVRQLADRSAKSLQEIEQIVLQIQTETGSVMTAMEEGIQQVLDVTERSEQAKRSLEDIIQVSNRIDTLVRSITADTDEQRENSRSVAKVMQAVELTAQATSQESQRVAGSLQNLVGIGKDLISSVERFKVEGEK